MSESGSRPPEPARFFPRMTLALAGGFGLFILIAVLYCLPVLLEPPPKGAIADYQLERVRARLEGKVPLLLGGSLVAATGVAAAAHLRGRG